MATALNSKDLLRCFFIKPTSRPHWIHAPGRASWIMPARSERETETASVARCCQDRGNVFFVQRHAPLLINSWPPFETVNRRSMSRRILSDPPLAQVRRPLYRLPFLTGDGICSWRCCGRGHPPSSRKLALSLPVLSAPGRMKPLANVRRNCLVRISMWPRSRTAMGTAPIFLSCKRFYPKEPHMSFPIS